MNTVFLKKHILFFIITIIPVVGYGQQTFVDTNHTTVFNNALKLYNNKAYGNAEKKFNSFIHNTPYNSKLKSDAFYYEAMCAIKLNKTDADKKVLDFISKNPTSNKKNKAIFNVANYYFANKRAAYALKWYQKVNLDLLSNENIKELNYKVGYCLLVTKNYTLAKERFILLINDAKYGNDSRYYYGYIAYKLEDYGIAESTLKEIENNETYKQEISYYLLDINFKAGNFKRCVLIGLELIKEAKRKDQSEISKIIGESYFNLKKYSEAIPFLKNYKGKKGKWNNTDFYQLGYAYYKQNDFESAVNNFNKIIDEQNSISQNAYYHLGECYLNLDKKTEALNAFKSAAEMNFDKKIKEDAALNYAKLSYEEGNPFKSVAQVLQDYLKEYPKSKAYEEVNKLVVSSYIHQQDYKGALEFLSKKKSKENITLSLEVSLYRGIKLFNQNKIKEAIPFFEFSSKAENIAIQEKAKFWLAESYYRLNNFNESLTKFKSLRESLTNKKSEFKLIDYNIGYNNFKLKQYKEASVAFNLFLKKDSINNSLNDDALVRLGDCYFAIKNYKESIKSYQKVVTKNGESADYAQYQIGLIYGFTGDNNAKIKALTNVINKYQISSLKDDALFQLGVTYTTLKENTKAQQAYNRLIEKHSSSIFIPKALVRQGLLYYNNNQPDKALKSFKKVTSQYSNSPDAFEAVANARNIYIDKGNLDEYVNWIRTLKFINITNSDLDNTAFAVAEKKYFESKDGNDIIKNLTDYVNAYPDGIHRLKANYYLADILFKVKEFKKAISYYEIVVDEEQNEYSEDSLSKLTQIYLQDNKFDQALPYLDRLEQEAYSKENLIYAQSNLMKGYFETKAYDFAIEYAKKILLRDKIDSALELDAKTIIAKSSLKKEDFYTAEEYFLEVERNAKGELKAEALYYNAFFKHQQKDYTASNKVIQKLIEKYSAYKYWAVKSYVIMGKNYYRLKDVYQATFVLENIIKNFKQFEDIIAEAQTELDSIKEKEAKINNSITTKDKN